MSATLLLTNDNLEFGVPVVEGVVLQDVDFAADAKTTIVTGEYGMEIGVGIHGGAVNEIKGSYLYLGADITNLREAIPSTVGAAWDLTGDSILYGVGLKKTHEGFSTGDFKAINLDGSTTSTVG